MAVSKKRSGSEKRKRTPIILFRATEEERAEMIAAANRAGLTLGSYVRSRSLAKPTTRAVRRPPVEAAILAQLLGQLGVVGGTVAALANRNQGLPPASASEVSEALAAFREVANAILTALGKRPDHDH